MPEQTDRQTHYNFNNKIVHPKSMPYKVKKEVKKFLIVNVDSITEENRSIQNYQCIHKIIVTALTNGWKVRKQTGFKAQKINDMPL